MSLVFQARGRQMQLLAEPERRRSAGGALLPAVLGLENGVLGLSTAHGPLFSYSAEETPTGQVRLSLFPGFRTRIYRENHS
jgi:hypothetical protein